MKVWIIMGTTGEYSDRSEWPVRGYINEATARTEVEAMSARAREVQDEFRQVKYDFSPEGKARMSQIMQYIGDDSFNADYTGTSYYLMEVDIADFGWTVQ